MFKVELISFIERRFLKYYKFQDNLDIVYNSRIYTYGVFDNGEITKLIEYG